MRRALSTVALLGCACAHRPAQPPLAALEQLELEHVQKGGPNHAHMQRLGALAPAFAAAEHADPVIVTTAALLHDLTKEDGAGTPKERFCTHGAAGASVVRTRLPALGFTALQTDAIAAVIEQHMGPCGGERFMTRFCQRDYPAPATVEAKVVFDLDMLDLMTVNGVAKVVTLRQKGAGTIYPKETVRESALDGADSAWRSVREAGEVLLTHTGQRCGAALTAHTRSFLDEVDWARAPDAPAFQAEVERWLIAHPLPACFTPSR